MTPRLRPLDPAIKHDIPETGLSIFVTSCGRDEAGSPWGQADIYNGSLLAGAEINFNDQRARYRLVQDAIALDPSLRPHTAVLMQTILQLGRVLPLDARQRADAPDQEPAYRFLSRDERLAEPTLEPLVKGLLDRGTLALLFGRSGSYKSFFIAALADAILHRDRFAGLRVNADEAGTVCWIVAEGGGGLNTRLAVLEQETGDPLDRLYTLKAAPQFLEDGTLGDLIDALDRVPGPVLLIVIDTFSATAAGSDENAAGVISQYLNAAGQLRDRTGATVMISHHVNKLGTLRGSTAFLANVDSALALLREEHRLEVDLRIAKQRDGDDTVLRRFKARPVTLVDQVDEDGEAISSLVLDYLPGPGEPVRIRAEMPSGRSTESRRVALAVLGEAAEGMTYSEWRAATNERKTMNERTFTRVIKALVNCGAVLRFGEEKGATYCIPDDEDAY